MPASQNSSVKLLSISLIVVAILAFLLGKYTSVEDPKPPLKVIDVTILQSRLEKISELATVQYNYTDVSSHTKSEKIHGFKIPFSTSSILLRYDGVIKAGIDLHSARVDVADTVVTFFLPRPKILSHSVDPSSIKILNQNNGLFSSIKIADFQSFCAAHQDSIEKVAISAGLLDQAQDDASDALELVSAPLRDMGYHVVVRFEGDEQKNTGDARKHRQSTISVDKH